MAATIFVWPSLGGGPAFDGTAPGQAFAAGKPDPAYNIYAGAYVKPRGKEPLPPGVKSVRSHLKGLDITVEHAGPRRRAEFLRSIDPEIADPFAPTPGRPDPVLAFIVTFENTGQEQAVFNPGNVALISDHNDRAFPLDLSDLYMSAERRGVEDLQQVIDQSTKVLFDSATIIPAGGGFARLVVFRPIEGKWRQFQIHFSFLQIGRETHTVTFSFHRREEQGS